MRITSCTTLLAALLLAPTGLAQNLLANPSFETGSLSGWTFFPPSGTSAPTAQLINAPEIVPFGTGAYLCKIFGDFVPGSTTATGIFQSFAANAGDTFTLDCYSRQWSGDALIGAGPPGDNWAVMKMAFFDAAVGGTEIGGAEQEILTGTYPQNTWIDNPPVTGTAPLGTMRVEAFVLFLQPNTDGGALHVDELEFTLAGGVGTYAGTGEDLRIATAVGGGSPTAGPTNDIKLVPLSGGLLEVNVSSPGGAFAMEPYALFAQVFPTGFPPVPNPIFPELYFDGSAFILQNGIAQVIVGQPFGPFIGPSGGSSTYYQLPSLGSAGFSIMIQAVVVPISAPTLNGIYGASDAHELRYN